MIVNRQILELVNACSESLSWFTDVLGGGDANFQMSLDDAIRAMEQGAVDNPNMFLGWVDFGKSLSSNPLYIKAVAQYTYGGYVLVGRSANVYATLEAAKAARDTLQNEKFDAEKSAFTDFLYISAVHCVDGNETFTAAQSAVDGCTYAVFNPLDGNHYKMDTFEAAQEKLDAVTHAFLDHRCAVQVGRQIMINGEVAAVDIVEDA